MSDTEKQEIKNLPERYRPLSAWAYWGLTILFSVPVVGFVFLIIFAFSGANINRRSFARSYFCSMLLALIVFGAIFTIAAATGSVAVVLDALKNR